MISYWTEEKTAELIKLRADGHSARDIALRLGGGISREAVLGKCFRMHLPSSPTAKSAKAFQFKFGRKSKRLDPEIEHPPINIAPALIDGRNYTTTDLGPSNCRWPHGDPQSADFYYCGRWCKTGDPYCEGHKIMAAHSTPKRSETR